MQAGIKIFKFSCSIIKSAFVFINRIAFLRTKLIAYFIMVLKSFQKAILFFCIAFVCTSCAVKKGCPSNGANIGAERILSGDPKALKAIKKGKKFRAYNKILKPSMGDISYATNLSHYYNRESYQ